MSTLQNPTTSRFTLLEPAVSGRKKALPLTVRATAGSNRLVFISEPGGVGAEQYRVMRRKLAERYPEGAVMLITSPGPGDGKTLTSTNLAWCLAESGAPTLLAEMDVRNSSIARLLSASPESKGMEAVLTEESDPEDLVRQVNSMQFYVLPAAGRADANALKLLSGANMQKFLNWARTRHKWVVLDSPPLFPMADSLELSSLADFAILVVRVRKTPRVLVEKAIEHLGRNLQQVVMNESTECSDSSYHYLSAYEPYGTKKKSIR